MKILLTQSYWLILDPKELRMNKPYPPLGTLYAAALLNNAGHEIFFVDGMAEHNLNAFGKAVSAFRPDLVVIYDDEFNYLTKMCLSNMREAALDMIRLAKRLSIPTVIYSSDATDHTLPYLEAGCDAALCGEGEMTLQEIVQSFADNHFSDVKEKIDGIRFLEKGEVHATAKRAFIDNLDHLPDPDFSFVDIDRYRKIWNDHHGYFSLNISTTRGCPYHCNWCAKPIYGQIYHSLSPQNIARRFKMLKETHRVDHIWITDDIFGLKPGWLEEFASVSATMGIQIPYKCLTRADLLLKNNTIQLLRDSGCETIWIGAESGSQRILDAMEKGTRVEQIYEATRKARLAGLEIGFFIQFGYTGETWRDIQWTRKMVRECLPDELGISVSYPLPGTKFYEAVKSDMKAKTHWTDSDDLDLMFTGTYERTFYKTLHRFVHAEYRFLLAFKREPWLLLPRLTWHAVRYMIFKIALFFHMFRKRPEIA